MDFRNIWVLRGPNHWTRSPALEVEVVLPRPPAAPPEPAFGVAFEDRLGALLASLGGHPPAAQGEASGVREPPVGTNLSLALARLTLALQRQAGSPVSFTAVKQGTGEPGICRVVVECEEEKLGRACLETARELLLRLARGEPLAAAALQPRLEALRD